MRHIVLSPSSDTHQPARNQSQPDAASQCCAQDECHAVGVSVRKSELRGPNRAALVQWGSPLCTVLVGAGPAAPLAGPLHATPTTKKTTATVSTSDIS